MPVSLTTSGFKWLWFKLALTLAFRSFQVHFGARESSEQLRDLMCSSECSERVKYFRVRGLVAVKFCNFLDYSDIGLDKF